MPFVLAGGLTVVTRALQLEGKKETLLPSMSQNWKGLELVYNKC